MAGDDDRTAGHSLSDHQWDEGFAHEHGPDADHDHDDFGPPGALEDNPIWLQDNVFLKSVGIDIGSSGTQVIFSAIHLRRIGEDLTSRYVIIARETLYQSPVCFTPYASETLIDAAALGGVIDEAYQQAKLSPLEIDTGAVILTGEALRRENAAAIAEILSAKGGQLVCATAGHHMEAMLAAYGSGAARRSFDEGTRLLNVDIGGGTAKLALIERGTVISTAAFHVGGRLLVVDEENRIVRLDPAGRHHALQAGYDWCEGDVAASDALDAVAAGMASALIEAIVSPDPEPAIAHLFLTERLKQADMIDGMVFSGGVGEYVYQRETRDFGDLGARLGAALRERLAAGALPWPLLDAGECIRATALGASEYSVQLSGATSFISDAGKLLPRRNLQVLRPPADLSGDIDATALGEAIARHIRMFDKEEADEDIVLAFEWSGLPEYRRIRAFAEGLKAASAGDRPLYVTLDGDIAMTLGAILTEELGMVCGVLVLDGLSLRDFDFIDLGRVRLPSRTVPVTVKSLVFSEQVQGSGQPVQRLHHREWHPHDHHHHDRHGHEHSHDHGHHHHSHHHDDAGERRAHDIAFRRHT